MDVERHAFETADAAVAVGDRWTAAELGTVLGWSGRLARPDLLWNAWAGRLLDDDAVAAHVGHTWSLAEYPDAALGHDRWRVLFAAAGYTVDGGAAERPAAAVELWRGSVPARRGDWSWSSDWETAGHYAVGGFGRPAGKLYRMVAPAAALLCANNGRDEAEFVVDTDHPGVVIMDA
ncbi:hypothetical protein ACF07L_35170 [Streptomyces anulatus]|uniref:hypothetical protein n=1 Tax=Streptomyces anulatus TaxID=1892 RepID=UPI0036FAA675